MRALYGLPDSAKLWNEHLTSALTAVCGLATKCKAPTDADQKCVDRVVGYLANTIDLTLKCNVKDLVLHAYLDANWACHPDLKGHSGILITLGHYEFPIFCKSQKHKVVTRSSTEAELVCLYAGIDILLYIRRIGPFLGIKVDEPVQAHGSAQLSVRYVTIL